MIVVKPLDILTFDGDAIVNPANISLTGGGGLDGAVLKSAGTTEVVEYLSFFRRESVYGGVYPSPAYRLPCKWILHAVGIPYSEPQCAKVYEALYPNLAMTCRTLGIKSVAIPALGMGIFRVPLDEGVKWMAQGMSHFHDLDVTIATNDHVFERLIKGELCLT